LHCLLAAVVRCMHARAIFFSCWVCVSQGSPERVVGVPSGFSRDLAWIGNFAG